MQNSTSWSHDRVEPSRMESATLSSGVSRFERVMSRIRSRQPTRFTHPLSSIKSSPNAVVDFEGPDDPYRPLNWAFHKKVVTTVLYGLTTMGATLASSIYTPGIPQIDAEFRVGEEVGQLGLTLLLFGFGLGPLVWAPLSEIHGRKYSVLGPFFAAALFSFGTAAAKDIQTALITRFFTGFFGSAPVTNTGGVLSDIWSAEHRGPAIVGYAMAVVGGPVLGPLIGGAIIQSPLRWRWTEYITGIYMLSILILDVLFIDESCPPVLLVYKARRLRYESGNWSIHARQEEWDASFEQMAHKYLIRPFQLLATPICFLMALYASFVYGILYLSLASFPIEFEEERGWNPVVAGLPFLALLVGILIGAVANVANQRFYIRHVETHNHSVPEARLPPMMLGSVAFAVGLFIFGWTSSREIAWIGPVIGAAFMGLGFFTVFQAALNYLIDTFSATAASAVAANTFLRSVFAGCFPLFANPMFHNLGINWASSLLGCIAVALIPIPYVFYIFGERIRAKGKWSRSSVYPDS